MNVCLVTGEYPPDVGGIGDFTHLLERQLGSLGHRVTVITGRHPGRTAAPAGDATLQEVDAWGWGSLEAVRRLVAEADAQVVHLQYQTAAFGMHPAVCFLPGWLQRAGFRTAVTFHDLRRPYLFPKAAWLRGFVTRHLVRSCGVAIATNPADAHVIGALRRRDAAGGVAPVVPIGCNIPLVASNSSDRAAVRARFGLAPEVFVAGFLGITGAPKGADTLVDALRVLQAEERPVHLLFVGDPLGTSDPTTRRTFGALRTAIAGAGLGDRVRFTGYLDPVAAGTALAALDCCVLPFAEGASYRRSSLVTAMAHGVPVVTTTPAPGAMGGGLPPLEDGENCLLVAPGSAAGVAGAILRLADDAVLRSQLAAGSRRFAAAFSFERVAAATLACYEALLERPDPATARAPV